MELFLTAYLIIILLTIILASYLIVFTWQHRDVKAATEFCLYLIFCIMAAVSFLGLSFSSSEPFGLFWVRLRLFSLLFFPIFFLLFVIEYTNWAVSRRFI